MSQRQLAAQYGVSRRLVSMVQDPEKLERNKELRAKRGGWRQYYDKDAHAASVREHRRYKAKVMKGTGGGEKAG